MLHCILWYRFVGSLLGILPCLLGLLICRLLTMPSGERIQFANNVNFIFECHSLQHASPATVSRCGMLLMSDEHIDVDNMVATWLSKQPADQAGGPTLHYCLAGLHWTICVSERS